MKTNKELRNKIRSTFDSNLNMTVLDLHKMFPLLSIEQLKRILMSEWE